MSKIKTEGDHQDNQRDYNKTYGSQGDEQHTDPNKSMDQLNENHSIEGDQDNTPSKMLARVDRRTKPSR